MTEFEIKGDVSVLRLQPGDIIVVTVKRAITAEQAARIKEQAREAFGDYKVVVVDSESTISVTRQEAA